MFKFGRSLFQRKQALAKEGGSRYYGDGGTIHQTGELDIVTADGIVTEVWFRCQELPFRQVQRGVYSSSIATSRPGLPEITGVEVRDK